MNSINEKIFEIDDKISKLDKSVRDEYQRVESVAPEINFFFWVFDSKELGKQSYLVYAIIAIILTMTSSGFLSEFFNYYTPLDTFMITLASVFLIQALPIQYIVRKKNIAKKEKRSYELQKHDAMEKELYKMDQEYHDLLIHFDVTPYETLSLPEIKALSDQEKQTLKNFFYQIKNTESGKIYMEFNQNKNKIQLIENI